MSKSQSSTVDPTPNLTAANLGHSDGWNGRPQKTGKGSTYIAFYKHAVKARRELELTEKAKQDRVDS